jgi:hypothetical protein
VITDPENLRIENGQIVMKWLPYRQVDGNLFVVTIAPRIHPHQLAQKISYLNLAVRLTDNLGRLLYVAGVESGHQNNAGVTNENFEADSFRFLAPYNNASV